MIVTLQSKGQSITGIRIETSDAQRLFPPGLKSVDLELDDLRIRCRVLADSRHHQAEISDPRLTAWLGEKLYWQGWPGTSVPVEMLKCRDGYRLQLPAPRRRRPGFGLNV